ncbi:MAG: DNA-processing protein DprA [Chloroflexota bacterium]|nr:DNA-processing protein DprA [Chloroflexota bacterium]
MPPLPQITPSLAYVGFNLVKGLGPVRLRRLLDQFGDVAAAWAAPVGDLVAAGLDGKTMASLLLTRQRYDPAAMAAQLATLGASLLTWDDAAYPDRLRDIDNSPPVLYLLGDLVPDDGWAVGVVGTRQVTGYGREVTARLAGDLARSRVTVISGLARGVDTLAHQAALDAGGRTIAVLGSGVDQIYPPENQALARRIVAEGRGAVISDYPPGTRPDAINFPPRNRIISGLSLGVLIVEAGLRSGALITQRFALEQNREVFAVPGNIFSAQSEGPNDLLKQGAKPVTRVGDILEELQLGMVADHVEAVLALPDDPTERALLAWLRRDAEPQHIDAIARGSGLPVHTVSSTLTLMELKGMVRQVGPLQYVPVR